MVLCVDMVPQIQALERTQPLLPKLSASLDVATGEVISQCVPRHRPLQFLGLLHQIEKSAPEDLDVHLIVDNYCTHMHAKVRSWL